MATTSSTDPSRATRILGALGVIGGLALLSTFIVGIAPDPNVVRIVVYGTGAISVIVAVHLRAGSAAPKASRVIAVIAIAAYALLLARELLPYGSWHPFAGDDGLTLFVAGMAIWLSDAAFGLATAWYRMAARPSAWLLAGGSLLAMTGIDRLQLTSPAAPTIFGPISQVGLVLTGVAWVVLGAELVTQGRASPAARSGEESPIASTAT